MWPLLESDWNKLDEENFKRFINRMLKMCKKIITEIGVHFDEDDGDEV